MTRFVNAISVVMCLCLVSPVYGKKSKSSGPLTFHEMSLNILDTLQSFQPETSTEMGIHTYDHKLTDYSPGSVSRMIGVLERLRSRLERFDTTSMKTADKIDFKLLNSNLDVALLNLQGIGWHKRSPYLYVYDAIDGLYFLMLSRHASLGAKLPSIMGRLNAVPAFFATAQKNLRNVPKVYAESAQEALKAGREFYSAVGKQLVDSFPGRAQEIKMTVNKATAAMDDFTKYLSNLKPGPDTAFAIGKTNYDYLLKHQYFLPYDSDSLLKIGEALLKQAQNDYNEYRADVEANKQNGQDSVYIPKDFTREDLLDYYGWEVNQVKTFIRMGDIITIPDNLAPVRVMETPAFLRPMIGGIAYQPAGPFDDNQEGIFYVRPIPDSISRSEMAARYRYVHRRGFRGSVVHEAFPGHHLQMQLAGRVTNPVRRWQMNNQFIEGWALYCEEMMYHAGLFGAEDPAQWLGILGGVRFRAARIIADVKLQTGKFTYDQCVDWMFKTLESKSISDSNYVRTEVRRYTHEPTQPMGYLTGKREIQRLYDAMAAKQGVDFDEKEFYDALLAEGSIPPALLWQIMGIQPVTSGIE